MGFLICNLKSTSVARVAQSMRGDSDAPHTHTHTFSLSFSFPQYLTRDSCWTRRRRRWLRARNGSLVECIRVQARPAISHPAQEPLLLMRDIKAPVPFFASARHSPPHSRTNDNPSETHADVSLRTSQQREIRRQIREYSLNKWRRFPLFFRYLLHAISNIKKNC